MRPAPLPCVPGAIQGEAGFGFGEVVPGGWIERLAWVGPIA